MRGALTPALSDLTVYGLLATTAARWPDRDAAVFVEHGVRWTWRQFLAEVDACIKAFEDFAFETTLAGRSYLKLVRRLRAEGWRVELIYLALPSMEMSRLRVAERVAHGGHNIPLVDIDRRFARSLHHLLEVFSSEVDACRCFMNSGAVPELIFEQQGELRSIVDAIYYQHLLKEVTP